LFYFLIYSVRVQTHLTASEQVERKGGHRYRFIGIDFETIADWLGHQNGGMLLCKVYSHLLDGHNRTYVAAFSTELNVSGTR